MMQSATNKFRTVALAGCLLMGLAAKAFPAGKFTVDDYKRALWMTTRFYGGQRSGVGPNWLIKDHTYKTSFTKDAYNGTNLAGGWFDCGDHVTFGQTFFYSAYVLAKAYDAFPQGFEDNYHGTDYSDYSASGNWDKSGGSADGIPDLLQELKYATDWIIKATPNSSTFYYQKGDAGDDHNTWVTAGYMSTQSVSNGGEPRNTYHNPSDGVMPGFAAGALAIMSRVYRKYDAAYADTCLAHAKLAYAYATTYKGQAAASVGQGYPANANPNAAFVIAATELYKTTGTQSYSTDATGNASNLKNHNWSFCYANNDDVGYYNLGTILNSSNYMSTFKSYYVTTYNGYGTGENGLSTKSSDWGALRYIASQAFIVALYDKAANVSTYDDFVYNQVDYILGANNAKQSFVVGFCSGCSASPQHPHHRNVYLNDTNPSDADKQKLPIPTHNAQFGYMVGGTLSSTAFAANDLTPSYQYAEGGIDYNAGLVGALAYIVSELSPVDTSKFGASSIASPHPSSASLSLRTSGRTVVLTSGSDLQEVAVTDLRGREVARFAASGTSASWTAPNAGLYLIRSRTANGWASAKALLQ